MHPGIRGYNCGNRYNSLHRSVRIQMNLLLVMSKHCKLVGVLGPRAKDLLTYFIYVLIATTIATVRKTNRLSDRYAPFRVVHAKGGMTHIPLWKLKGRGRKKSYVSR